MVQTGEVRLVIGTDPPKRRQNKAGAFGVFSVLLYGVVCAAAVFVAAYFWLDGDATLAAAIGIGSLAVPVTFGFFVAEWRNQRSGVLAFVIAAAVVAGAAGASAYLERDDYEARRDFFNPPALADLDIDADD